MTEMTYGETVIGWRVMMSRPRSAHSCSSEPRTYTPVACTPRQGAGPQGVCRQGELVVADAPWTPCHPWAYMMVRVSTTSAPCVTSHHLQVETMESIRTRDNKFTKMKNICCQDRILIIKWNFWKESYPTMIYFDINIYQFPPHKQWYHNVNIFKQGSVSNLFLTKFNLHLICHVEQ